MEPITLLLAILGVYGSGIIAKAGEDSFDATRQLVKRKLTGTSTGKALKEGKDPDPRQAVIDVEAIAQDPEIEQLLKQIQTLLSKNEALKKQLESAQKRLRKTIQINNDQAQGYQFNDNVETQSIGGIHYHD